MTYMELDASTRGDRTLLGLRRIVLAVMIFGALGTGLELMLLEHTEDFWQLVPIVLIALSFAAILWHAVRPSALSVLALKSVMTLIVISGGVGVWLHYQGNVEFELEMYPELSGTELFWESMKGATPALAPGTMTVLGLLGLAYTYRLSRRPQNS